MLRFLSLVALALVCPIAPSASAPPPADRCASVNFGPLVNGTHHLPPGRHTLPAGCTFRVKLVITNSDTTLDCSGSALDGSGVPPIVAGANGKPERGGATGLVIYAPPKATTQNVTVRNCAFRNYSRDGITISSGFSASQPSPDTNRSVRNVLIDFVTIEKSGHVGLYIRPRSTDILVRNSTITNSAGTAVYIELAQRVRLLQNRFVRNGWSATKRRLREAVAIDASTETHIASNLFKDNGLGGIFLYRNCGEFHGFTRWQSSDRNTISENVFVNEEVGVWIASRQSVDVKNLACSAPPMDSSGRYVEDFANNNRVQCNVFCSVSNGVRVEGDNNEVVNNTFSTGTSNRVQIPETARGRILGRPPVGNVTSPNATDELACVRPPEPTNVECVLDRLQ